MAQSLCHSFRQLIDEEGQLASRPLQGRLRTTDLRNRRWEYTFGSDFVHLLHQPKADFVFVNCVLECSHARLSGKTI